jgi:hypothetical protein
MVNGADLKDWAVTLLINWHNEDPVSEKETDRNNTVYIIQQNRNPFIDHPEWADCIWDDNCDMSIEEIGIPDKIILDQNYPNPFNSTTTIPFNLSATADIELVIFDMLGRKLEELVSGRIVSDEYEINWDASVLPSGVYFVRLITERQVQTKKMVFLQ